MATYFFETITDCQTVRFREEWGGSTPKPSKLAKFKLKRPIKL